MFREHSFVVSTGADYNRPQNYRIAKFLSRVVVKTVMGWEGGGKGCGRLRLSFECSKGRGEGATKIEQVRTRGEGGSKYKAVCDNVITECPLL